MRKLLKTISLLSVVTLLSSSVSASPQIDFTPEDTRNVIELLRSCDSSNRAGKEAVLAKDALILEQQKLIETQTKVLTSQADRREEGGIYWFIAGMLTAGLTVYLVKP
jgi:hypothetical protein